MRWFFVAFAGLLCAANAGAALPVVEGIFPLGGQRGTSVTIKAEGKFDTWPVKGWADSPAIHLQAAKDAGTFTVQIDKDAPVGPHLIRLYTDDDVTPPRVFFVTNSAEIIESEPNDDPRRAQSIATFPVTVNGQLEKTGDVDCYSVHLEAGQRLVASVQGRRLGSPMDPMLHLTDVDSNELAFAHDGLGLDPLLSYQATKSRNYIVRVSAFSYPPASDVRLAGGKGDYYRLYLTTDPFVRFLWPSGIRRGERGKVELLGWNVLPSSVVSVDATHLPLFEDHLFVPCPGEGLIRAEVSEGPELIDADARKADALLTVPVNITGRLATPGEEHRFRLAMKTGESIRGVIRAGAMNSPVDAELQVTGPAGATLANGNGDGLAKDAVVNFDAPKDGTCIVSVSDLFHKGGPDYIYRLELFHPAPTVSATIDGHAYKLAAGKSAVVKMNVSRQNGHASGLVAVATDLPVGVIATSAEVPVKGGEVTLTLTAAGDAKATNKVIHIALLGTDPAKPEAYPARYVRQETEGAIEMIPLANPWLTVLPPPATAPATKPAMRRDG